MGRSLTPELVVIPPAVYVLILYPRSVDSNVEGGLPDTTMLGAQNKTHFAPALWSTLWQARNDDESELQVCIDGALKGPPTERRLELRRCVHGLRRDDRVEAGGRVVLRHGGAPPQRQILRVGLW